ncbi:hypothetical protein VOLCADRAFT_118842 [Volvox carteri f. nagariensis]|uniref:Thioesterase domain-containing protein n=1 Tax=Volvox carteri f. nagariensis TaxID=3068 RepID=D8U811_VOLCA|nr:uncharacterized protein VOLCADRAFT_118842 [Volvox carteri f. nagariensis]EFJ44187.1 hypothetical protein VOLCADRAFT_118842 [Volvox carteri f. nagariensis]|eukprot:XP_002954781.1 hypothetical protein VOLCADRAFT_118842 [Volvox carteri f. nagariensis]
MPCIVWRSEEELRKYFRDQLSTAGPEAEENGNAANTPHLHGGGSNGATVNGEAQLPAARQAVMQPSCGTVAMSPTAARVAAAASEGGPTGPSTGKAAAACLRPDVLSRMRILAFHSAGNAEDMWTSEGTGVRRSPSPLLEWCRSSDVEMLAVQMPGRGSRAREPFITTAQAAARELLPVVQPLLESGVPYAVLSHSFGTWICFELLRAVRRAGLPLPRIWCLSAMPYPDVPYSLRPWRQQRALGDADFQEEVRGWDVNEVVFTPDMWQLYEPILRADCTVFDEYELQPDDPYKYDARQAADADSVAGLAPLEPFDFPIEAFWGNTDRRVRSELVAPWARYTRAGFRLTEVAGNHLWPINNREAKTAWLNQVVQAMNQAVLLTKK